jgi:hypothetical protein
VALVGTKRPLVGSRVPRPPTAPMSNSMNLPHEKRMNLRRNQPSPAPHGDGGIQGTAASRG